MDKRKKSVQFSVEVYDERDTRCGIPLCPVTLFSDLRFLTPLSIALVFVQGLVSYQQDQYQEQQEKQQQQQQSQHEVYNKYDAAQHVGVFVSCLVFSYFGRNHKPRCMGIAAILTAVACFILGFRTTLINKGGDSSSYSILWFLGPISQFLNGVGLLISVSVGASYFDNNFPRYFPLILGIGAAVKIAASLVTMRTSLWMTFGSLIGIASLPIALLPKIINRQKTANYGVTVTPTDDPSIFRELKNSIYLVAKSEILLYNCLTFVFFTLGLNLICNERIGMGIQAVGFLLSGWFIQFVKPRSEILAGANIFVGVGFLIHTIIHTFYCHCDFINYGAFAILLFFSCFGRIGAFLFSIRSVEKNEQPLAIGLTFAIISIFLIPKSIFLDLACPCVIDETLENLLPTSSSSSCLDLCCQTNLVPNLIGAGFTSIGLFFAWLVWRIANLDLYKS